MGRGLIFALALAGCTEGAIDERFISEVSAMQPDPAIAEFLAAEARQAGVSRIILTDNTGMMREVGQAAYGLARYDGRTRRTELYFNIERQGGASITNISHEIAHAQVYRQGCFGHGELWMNAHLEMAMRFETTFPGVLWSGQQPTTNVEAKRTRYRGATC